MDLMDQMVASLDLKMDQQEAEIAKNFQQIDRPHAPKSHEQPPETLKKKNYEPTRNQRRTRHAINPSRAPQRKNAKYETTLPGDPPPQPRSQSVDFPMAVT